MDSSIEVENIIASTIINTKNELDLDEMSSKIENTRYEKEFPSLVYRIEILDLSMLFFKSQKLICTGAKNKEEIHKAINEFIKKLEGIGIEINEKPEIKIQNIVAVTDLKNNLNLNALAVGIGLEKVEY